MPDAVELVKVMKKAAVEAMNAEKPAAICYGKVVSVSPLQICVEQKMTLSRAQLVLTRNVTEYRTYMEIGNAEMEVIVHNGLAAGDEVIMLRQQGGQKYIVWERIV